MYSVNSYQDIKDPDELEEERRYESILQGLLEEYDPDEGDYKSYQNWCRKRAREIASKSTEEEDD
jgi:hypothetical protein